MTAGVNHLTRVCALGDVPPGEMLRIEAEGVPAVVLINSEGRLTALRDQCSHGEFRLSEGYLETDRVECPLHGAYFCVRSGRNLTPPATKPVEIFPVLVNGQDVLIDFGGASD